MGRHCCVPLCSNKASKPGHSFYSFPNCEDLRKKWLDAIGLKEGPYFKIRKNTTICSAHFEKEHYHPSASFTLIKRLLPTAVPSKFNWKHTYSAKEPSPCPSASRFVAEYVKVDPIEQNVDNGEEIMAEEEEVLEKFEEYTIKEEYIR